MVGIKDIAREAGVSIATVSNVLHGKRNMSDKTREKILAIAKELGYELPKIRIKEKSSDNKTIVVNFSDFDTNFYLNILLFPFPNSQLRWFAFQTFDSGLV